MNSAQSLASGFVSRHLQHLCISIYSTLILGRWCLGESRRWSGADASVKKVSNEGR
jgi:hypothetical protein